MTKRRILIIDDDIYTLNTLKLGIEQFFPDYHSIVTTNGLAVLDQLRNFDEVQPFDLILTDYDMPGINGLELARAVRQIRPDIRIVLMSGYPNNSELQDKINVLNLEGYIQKPFSVRQLGEFLQPSK